MTQVPWDCTHINEISYFGDGAKNLINLSTISVSNEFGEAWHNIPFNVFCVIRDNLAPHQLVVSRPINFNYFSILPTMPFILAVSHSIVLASLMERTETTFFLHHRAVSDEEEQKPSVFGILMMEKSVFRSKDVISRAIWCVYEQWAHKWIQTILDTFIIRRQF